MKMLADNPQRMHRMPAGRARVNGGIGSASAYAWHAIACPSTVVVFVDSTKLPARRLSEVPL